MTSHKVQLTIKTFVHRVNRHGGTHTHVIEEEKNVEILPSFWEGNLTKPKVFKKQFSKMKNQKRKPYIKVFQKEIENKIQVYNHMGHPSSSINKTR